MKIVIEHKSFEDKLTLGEFKFEYTKKDGTVREARGTTKVELIPEGLRANGGMKATKGTPYFDLEINDWRSVTTESDIVTTLESLSGLPGLPALTEEETTVMLWNYGALKDEWLVQFIHVIYGATPQDATELLNGKFKNLIRVIKKFQEDPDYAKELQENWQKIVGDKETI
jgi:hypothetical protein